LSSDRIVTESDIFLNRGLASYELERYHEAIEDFKRITEPELLGHKHNNLGSSYIQIGLSDEAHSEYIAAIKSDSKLVQAYYNLATISMQEHKYEQARKMLDTCLKITRNFKPAKKLLALLNKEKDDNWYSWWFENSYIKRFLGAFIILLLSFIFTAISLIVILGEKNLDIILGQLSKSTNLLKSPQFSNQDIGILTLVVFALLTILLFPGLKKIKMGPYEIETITPSSTGPIFPSSGLLRDPALTSGTILPRYDLLHHPALTSSPQNR